MAAGDQYPCGAWARGILRRVISLPKTAESDGYKLC